MRDEKDAAWDRDRRGRQHALDEQSFVEKLSQLRGEVVGSGDTSGDLALSLALNDRLTNDLVSSRADEMHWSVTDGQTIDGLTIPNLTFKSAQAGPKPAPEPQAWTKSPSYIGTKGPASPTLITPPDHAFPIGDPTTQTPTPSGASIPASDAASPTPRRSGFFSDMSGFDPV